MDRPIEAFTWEELRTGYLQYTERLKQIAQYLNIVDHKVPLNPKPGEVFRVDGLGVSDYMERLFMDRTRVAQKRDAIKAEVIRRSALIGAIS